MHRVRDTVRSTNDFIQVIWLLENTSQEKQARGTQSFCCSLNPNGRTGESLVQLGWLPDPANLLQDWAVQLTRNLFLSHLREMTAFPELCGKETQK